MPRRAKQKRNYLSEPALFDREEGTFLDTHQRRRVYVHLVPAPWSRVIVYSLVYALAVSFTKFLWFYFLGEPEWLIARPVLNPTAVSQPLKK